MDHTVKQLDDKYSPNLARWLRKRKLRTGMPQSVFRDAEGSLWIGWLDDDFFLIGSRLMAVLCNGADEDTWAYPLNRLPAMQEVTGFWNEYERVGRCAIDPEHSHHFLSRNGRFKEEGDSRMCRWCGHKQQRETFVEHVPRERWVSHNA